MSLFSGEAVPATLDEVMATTVGAVLEAIVEDDNDRAKEVFDEAMAWVERHYQPRPLAKHNR